jgi:outer membrane protein assembly factor BamB
LNTKADIFDRIAIIARPGPTSAPISFDSNRYYLAYTRAVVGLDASNATVAWARSFAASVVAGAGFDGGVAVCLEDGTVHTFDATTGASLRQMSFGAALESCVIQADGYAPAKPVASVDAVVDQIASVVREKGTDLLPLQEFLVKELKGAADEQATRVLIELMADEQVPGALGKELSQALAARRNGVKFMLNALSHRYDYLHGVVTPPPVGPLAQALAALDEKAAAPLLLEHLLDPTTSPGDLRQAAEALSKLAGASEEKKLEDFFALYRCTAENDDTVQAVLAVAKALIRIDAERARPVLQAALNDGMTVGAVRTVLEQIAR